MRRRILIFSLSFLPLFAVSVWLYPRLLPAYQKMVLGGANVGLQRFDPPMRVEIGENGGWSAYLVRPDRTESFYWNRPAENLNLTLLSLALLPALLLATPVKLSKRLLILGVGLLLLSLSHVLAAIGLVRTVHCLANDPGNPLCTWVRTIVNIYGQLISIALWGLLTWDVWLPRPDTASGAQSRTS